MIVVPLILIAAVPLVLITAVTIYALRTRKLLAAVRECLARKRLIRQTHEADPPELCLADPDWDKAVQEELS